MLSLPFLLTSISKLPYVVECLELPHSFNQLHGSVMCLCQIIVD